MNALPDPVDSTPPTDMHPFMRILHLIYDHPENPWLGGGGAIRAHEINRRLVARGHSVRTICGGFPGAPAGGLRDGVRYEFTGRRGPYLWSRLIHAARASQALRGAAYDVAVVDVSAYSPIRVPRSPTRPIVGIVHHLLGSWAPDRWGAIVGGLIARDELRRISRIGRVSAVSEHTRGELLQRLPEVEVRVIGNAVDEALFEASPRESDPPYLLYLGRLDIPHKGIDLAIRAFERVAGTHPRLCLEIVGTGRDEGRIRQLIAASPMADRINLPGPRRGGEKVELLAGATIVLMPSRMEPWGIVAAEAMAAGVPLVCSRVGGLPEVTGERGAVLVPPGEVSLLADALDSLLSDPSRRRTLGNEGRARARERFHWDRITDAHERFLVECTTDSGRLGRNSEITRR